MEEKSLYRQRVHKCIEYARNFALADGNGKVEERNLRYFPEGTAKEDIRSMLLLEGNALSMYVKNYKKMHDKLGVKPFRHLNIIVEDCIVDSHIEIDINAEIYFKNCIIEKLENLHLPITIEESYIFEVVAEHQQISILNSMAALVVAKEISEIRSSQIDNLILRNCSGLHIEKSKIKQLSVSSESKFYSGITISSTEIELSPNGIEHVETTNNNIHINSVTFNDKASLHALCNFRTLKKLCHECEYEHGVILFHGLELETYYNTSLKNNCPFALWPEKFSHWLHKGFTDYGRDIMRPFFCIAYLFILGMWVAFAYYDLGITDSVRLSFKHSVGPMSFALNSDVWKALEPEGYGIFNFIHVITSSIIWFLIIFMIRRRFKI